MNKLKAHIYKLSGRKSKQSFFLLLPVMLCMIVLSFYPITRGIVLGFTDYKIGLPIKFNGFENYQGIIDNGYLGIAFKNTIVIIIISLVATYSISLVLSLVLNSDIPFRKFWRTILVIPWAVPPVAKVGVWKMIFSANNGHLNYLLKELHIIDKYIGWVSNTNVAIFSVCTMIVWGCVPFLTISFLATLQVIPKDNYEAADIDGATIFSKFRYITLPYLQEITTVTISLLFMWIAYDFSSQYLLTRGGPGSATLTLIVEAYRQGFGYGNFGISAAYGNVMILFISILLYFYIKYTTQTHKNGRDTGL